MSPEPRVDSRDDGRCEERSSGTGRGTSSPVLGNRVGWRDRVSDPDEGEVPVEDLEKVAELLTKLASDDEFRAEFERDPASVLADYGVDLAPGTRATLPPKEALVAALTNLARQTVNYGPFDFWGPTPSWWPGPWGSPWSPWGAWGGAWARR